MKKILVVLSVVAMIGCSNQSEIETNSDQMSRYTIEHDGLEREYFIYLPKDYELLYNARQLLMSKSYGVDNAISKVPAKFKNDAGLNYDRLKWRRKRGRVDDSVEILLKIN